MPFQPPPTTKIFQGRLAICNRVISNIHHIWDIQILLPGIEDSGEPKGIVKSQESNFSTIWSSVTTFSDKAFYHCPSASRAMVIAPPCC